MARPLRIEYPGGVYHLTSRGNARQPIFLSDSDRQTFLEILSLVAKRFHWLCHAYCLMDNHYHLLIETMEANLSRGMRQLNGIYTQRFNRQHGRVGHLFQGRYKAIVVDKEAYLFELCRYVVLNPVRAGMVQHPKAWRWSSYRATAGLEKVPEFLTVDWVLGQLAKERQRAHQLYEALVQEGLKRESPWPELKGQIFLGHSGFIDRIGGLLSNRGEIREIPRRQRYAARPSLGEIFRPEHQRHRDRDVYRAHVEYGYTLREISDTLGLHYTTVSKIIKSLEHQN